MEEGHGHKGLGPTNELVVDQHVVRVYIHPHFFSLGASPLIWLG
jgi:hypothetical protein